MKNYIQPGNTVTVPAPAKIKSGDGVLIGALFGVASTDAETGEHIALGVSGVYALPKEATSDTFAVGDALEWDVDNSRVTALSEGEKIGVAIMAASNTASSVRVRLDG